MSQIHKVALMFDKTEILCLTKRLTKPLLSQQPVALLFTSRFLVKSKSPCLVCAWKLCFGRNKAHFAICQEKHDSTLVRSNITTAQEPNETANQNRQNRISRNRNRNRNRRNHFAGTEAGTGTGTVLFPSNCA